MIVAIIIALIFAICMPMGKIRLWWNSYELTICCNWFALIALALYLIEKFY